MSKFGEHIKKLREEHHFLQKHIAAHLDIDTPMLSKIERGERKAKKQHVILLANILQTQQSDLLTLWLADQVYDVVKNEEVALKAIQVAEEQIKYQTKRNK